MSKSQKSGTNRRQFLKTFGLGGAAAAAAGPGLLTEAGKAAAQYLGGLFETSYFSDIWWSNPFVDFFDDLEHFLHTPIPGDPLGAEIDEWMYESVATEFRGGSVLVEDAGPAGNALPAEAAGNPSLTASAPSERPEETPPDVPFEELDELYDQPPLIAVDDPDEDALIVAEAPDDGDIEEMLAAIVPFVQADAAAAAVSA